MSGNYLHCSLIVKIFNKSQLLIGVRDPNFTKKVGKLAKQHGTEI
jgi:hypothetical protein